MQRRPLTKNGIQPMWIHARDLAGVKPTKPLLQLVRTGEGFLHLDLLVENHSYEERKRVTFE